jgi:hypothetical protein
MITLQSIALAKAIPKSLELDMT